MLSDKIIKQQMLERQETVFILNISLGCVDDFLFKFSLAAD